MSNKERRNQPRISVTQRAAVVFPRAYRDVALLEISLKGALIEPTDMKGFFVGARCQLRVMSTTGAPDLDVGAVVVRRTHGRRVGLEIRSLTMRAEQAVQDLLEADAPQYAQSQHP